MPAVHSIALPLLKSPVTFKLPMMRLSLEGDSMRKRIARIYIRVNEGQGKQPYYPAPLTKTGVRAGFAVVKGVEKPVKDGLYYVRYTSRQGVRLYEMVGNDPQLAFRRRKAREEAYPPRRSLRCRHKPPSGAEA